MKKYLICAAVLSVVMSPVVTSTLSFAEEEAKSEYFKQRYDRFRQWHNSTDEEKKDAVETRKENIDARKQKWDSLTDEEKAAVKAKRKERHEARKAKAQEKYSTLSDEQKAKVDNRRSKIKDRRQNIRQKRQNHWNNVNE